MCVSDRRTKEVVVVEDAAAVEDRREVALEGVEDGGEELVDVLARDEAQLDRAAHPIGLEFLYRSCQLLLNGSLQCERAHVCERYKRTSVRIRSQRYPPISGLLAEGVDERGDLGNQLLVLLPRHLQQ